MADAAVPPLPDDAARPDLALGAEQRPPASAGHTLHPVSGQRALLAVVMGVGFAVVLYVLGFFKIPTAVLIITPLWALNVYLGAGFNDPLFLALHWLKEKVRGR